MENKKKTSPSESQQVGNNVKAWCSFVMCLSKTLDI